MEITGIPKHASEEVNQALIRLTDALCTWERETGRRNILIIREQGGYCCRADSGKCTIPDDIPDSVLLGIYQTG